MQLTTCVYSTLLHSHFSFLIREEFLGGMPTTMTFYTGHESKCADVYMLGNVSVIYKQRKFNRKLCNARAMHCIMHFPITYYPYTYMSALARARKKERVGRLIGRCQATEQYQFTRGWGWSVLTASYCCEVQYKLTMVSASVRAVSRRSRSAFKFCMQ